MLLCPTRCSPTDHLCPYTRLVTSYPGRRARRVGHRTREGKRAVRHAQLRLDPASRGLDHRGAGQCRDPGRRADGRLSRQRRRHQRAQHAQPVGRGSPKLKPYMALAETLGSLIGQLAHGPLSTISIEVEGTAADLNMKPITGAVLAGLMRVYSDTVNMVNAPLLRSEEH